MAVTRTLRALVFCLAFSIFPADLRQDLNRYKLLSVKSVRDSAADIDFDVRGVIDSLDQKLDSFYKEDPSYRKIRQSQSLGESADDYFAKEWNVNLRRLYLRDLLMEPDRKDMIAQAPNLFLAHFEMGKAQAKAGNLYMASAHYRMALRYRHLAMSPEVYTDGFRLELLEEPESRSEAEAYRKARDKARESDREMEKTRSQRIVTEDKLAQGKALITDLESARQREQSALEAAERDREVFREREKAYSKAKAAYDKESAAALVVIADTIRKLEDANREREKVLNKNAVVKSSFNQSLIHDYSPNRGFPVYAALLETAHRLDAQALTAGLLAEEKRSVAANDQAITWYEEYIRLASGEPAEKVLNARVRLAGLYITNGNRVAARDQYSLILNDPALSASQRPVIQAELAQTEVLATGDFDRARTLLVPLLSELESKNPADLPGRAQWSADRLRLCVYLSRIEGKTMHTQARTEYLRKGTVAWQDLQKTLLDQRTLVDEAYARYQNAKRPLLEETSTAALNEYLRMEGDYRNLVQEWDQMVALSRNVDVAAVYFGLANDLEAGRSVRAAIDVLTEAERLGVEPTRARREADRLRRLYF